MRRLLRMLLGQMWYLLVPPLLLQLFLLWPDQKLITHAKQGKALLT